MLFQPEKEPEIQYREFSAGGKLYKASVRIEARKNSRISFTKKGVSIVLSTYLKADARELQLIRFIEWAIKKIEKHPELITQYTQQRKYLEGHSLRLYGDTYVIKWEYHSSKEAFVKMRNGELVLCFPEQAREDRKHKIAGKLIAKLAGMYYKDKLTQRVYELNSLYFKRDVASVSIKNNSSNWGSCSSKKNINLSVRLLFTPEYVIDYVIIHELTHLIHMNHSEAYWAHVASVMPEYMEAERWLKKYGPFCVF